MPTAQYHEPPNELPERTRTFARMITSLIEEAKRLVGTNSGWRWKRTPKPRDHAERAARRDETFFHGFGVLARRKKKFRTILQDVLFKPGDIVEQRRRSRRKMYRGINWLKM